LEETLLREREMRGRKEEERNVYEVEETNHERDDM
jgi:hypothetical protein